jgi:serine/threonine protein kinase
MMMMMMSFIGCENHPPGQTALHHCGPARNGLLSLYQGIPTEVLREVALVRGLKHPNIVKLLDVEFDSGRALIMVMELFHCNLRDFMAELESAGACWMEVRSMKTFMRGILSGIAYCQV